MAGLLKWGAKKLLSLASKIRGRGVYFIKKSLLMPDSHEKISDMSIHHDKEGQSVNYIKQPIYFPVGPKKLKTVFVHNKYGQRVFLDPADYFIAIHYLEHLDWEDNLECVFKDSLKSKGAYIDIGANIGLHVLRASRLGYQSIYAFEPNLNTYDILSLNSKVNGIDSICIQSALGDYNGQASLSVNDVSAGMAYIDTKKNGDGLQDIPMVTLSHFFHQNQALKPEKLSLVKMDVEGYEEEVIRGAIEFLKGYAGFNMIIEFTSISGVKAAKLLSEHFTFTMKKFNWQKKPFTVDMSYLKAENTGEGDLVLFNVRKIGH